VKVRKRDGSLQDFDIDKVKLTLERVSDELNRPFTGSDLRILTKAIEEGVFKTGNEVIDSSEIHKIVVNELEKYDFVEIAKAYDNFK
jgi:transcriptional repressor NrdR